MTGRTIPISSLRPHLIGRAGQVRFADLAAKVYPIVGHPDHSLAVFDDPRRFVVIPRFCTHDSTRDLISEGHVEDGVKLGCYHRRRFWCLLDGKSNSDAPDMAVFAASLVDGNLIAWLPASVQCQERTCSDVDVRGTFPMDSVDDLDRDSDGALDVDAVDTEVLVAMGLGLGGIPGVGPDGLADISGVVGSTGVAKTNSLVEERGAC